jgi:hypothetical protein
MCSDSKTYLSMNTNYKNRTIATGHSKFYDNGILKMVIYLGLRSLLKVLFSIEHI